MAEITQITGNMTLREMYPKVNANVTKVNAEIVGHKSSQQAHAADAITYSGEVVGAATVKDAIDNVKNEVRTIVAHAGDGTKDTEIVLARKDAPTLGDRLDGVDAQLAEEAQKAITTQRALGYYWVPEAQPPARSDVSGSFIDGFRIMSNEVISNYMEPLRFADTDYMTRTNMGKDQSGLYDIWRYHLTPKNYKETIIIDTVMHGGEVTCLFVMLRFLHYLVHEWQNYPDLAYIRQNIRIIYTPIVNPWGMNQNNGEATGRTRWNSRGVDLNRNWGYLWNEFTGGNPFDLDYKGTAPFSEKETQYVKQTLEAYPDAIAYLNLHNTGTPMYDVYVPYAQKYNTKAYDNLIAYWVKGITDPVINLVETDKPSAPNYAYNVLGINASGPEWSDRRTGGGSFSSKDITDALTWFSNVIIDHARLYSKNKAVNEVYYRTKAGDTITVNPTGFFNALSRFKQLYHVPGDGVVTVKGVIRVKSNGAGKLTICPMLGQGGNGTGLTYDDRQLDRWGDEVIATAADQVFRVPFECSIPVKKTTVGGAVVRCGWGIQAMAETSSFDVLAYNAVLDYTPLHANSYVSLSV